MSNESLATASSQRLGTAHDAVVAPGWQSIADLPVGLAVFDRDVRYLAASRRWLEDNGLAGREVVGELHYDLFPDLPEEWKAVHQRALAGETVTAQNDCFERADGSRRWKNWECRPWYDASGAVGGIQMWGEDVTARVVAEAALAERMQEMQALAEGIPQMVWMATPDGVNVYSSPQWTSYTGLSAASSTGEGWSAMCHPDDLPNVWGAWQRAATATEQLTVESRLRRADGVYRWFLVRALPHRDAMGQIAKWIGSCTDIDDLKRAEASLALQTTALDAAANAIVITDRSGVIQWANAALNVLTGFTSAEVVGKKPGDLLKSGVHDQAFYEHMWSTILRGDVWHGEVVNQRKDGSQYTEEMTITPMKSAQGTITHFIAVKQDITERKLAEERQAQSHALLANLARLVPSAIYQYRLYPDGRSAFPYANHGISDIYEVTPEEVQEDATPVFGRLHPEDAERVGQLIMESARTLEEFYCEFRVILPRQGLRWRWSQAHPERTADGGTLWHGIISDITERKRAEQEKETLEAQLAQSQRLESVGLLAGGVAHDFNNMLGVILGTTELAIAQVDAAQPLHEDLQEIRKAAVRSADLTRQLLAFARQQTIAPVVLDLNETLPGMLAMLQRLIGEDISLHWQPTVALWPVMMDRSQMDQILTNLCVNARHAILDVGTVAIATANMVADAAFCAQHADAVPGDYVRLTVRDTGSGMNEATLARIFEPFFSTKSVGKGTGLGLATVYGAVKQNRGFVTVASVLGEGTTFEIYLPRHVGAPTPARHTGPVAADLRGSETILLVEDEPSLIRLITKALETQGYVVLTASSAADALRRATAHAGAIHLLLSDVVMPEMNGLDLAQALLKLRPTLKPLFMSGYTADVIATRGLLALETAFIEKPFTPVALAAKVREVLDGQ